MVARMGIAFLSERMISLELQVGNLAVLDVIGFPATLDWYKQNTIVIHNNFNCCLFMLAPILGPCHLPEGDDHEPLPIRH